MALAMYLQLACANILCLLPSVIYITVTLQVNNYIQYNGEEVYFREC